MHKTNMSSSKISQRTNWSKDSSERQGKLFMLYLETQVECLGLAGNQVPHLTTSSFPFFLSTPLLRLVAHNVPSGQRMS